MNDFIQLFYDTWWIITILITLYFIYRIIVNYYKRKDAEVKNKHLIYLASILGIFAIIFLLITPEKIKKIKSKNDGKKSN